MNPWIYFALMQARTALEMLKVEGVIKFTKKDLTLLKEIRSLLDALIGGK